MSAQHTTQFDPKRLVESWSATGDWIWMMLHSGKRPIEIKRELSEYVDAMVGRFEDVPQ